MLSLEAERCCRKGFGRTLQKRVNRLLAFHHDRPAGPRRCRGSGHGPSDARRRRSRNDEQRRQCIGLDVVVGAALHDVRPLAPPLDEAGVAPRQLLEALAEDDQLVPRRCPARQRVDDRALAERPVVEVGVDDADLRRTRSPRLVDESRADRILEVGTGSDRVSRRRRSWLCSSVAIDVSPVTSMLRHRPRCRRAPRHPCRHCTSRLRASAAARHALRRSGGRPRQRSRCR